MRFLGPVKFKLIVAGLGALMLGGIAVGASAATGATAFLTASTPTPSATPHTGSPSRGQAACTDFIHHLAQNVGKTDGQTRADIIKSAEQTIDDAVKAGKLTAAQAAKLKQRLNNANLCNLSGRFGERRSGFAFRMELLKAAATTLHITPQQLMQDLRQGKTLSSLANGMSEDQFRTQLLANLKTDLDALVASHKLTSAEETKLLTRLQTAPIPFWNSVPKAGR